MRTRFATSWLIASALTMVAACGRLGFGGDKEDQGGGDGGLEPGQVIAVAPTTAGFNSGDFGWSVALRGDELVIGAPTTSSSDGMEIGAAYVFRRDSDGAWIERQVLTPAAPNPGDRFGERVAFAGDRIVVAASEFDDEKTDQGAAVVFEKVGDEYEQALLLAPDDVASADFFGISLATAPGVLAVGSYYDDPNEQGAGYIFRSDGPIVETAKLTPNMVMSNDNFGTALAVSSDTTRLVGGSPYRATEGTQAGGAAYVFEETGSGYSEVAELTPPNVHDFMFFGIAVAIDGDWAAIAANQENIDEANDAGAVHLFHRDGTWQYHSRLVSPNVVSGEQFGARLLLRGDRLLIGAPYANGGRGALYFYQRQGDAWENAGSYTGPDDLSVEAHIGEGIAMDGNLVVSGAHRAFDKDGRVFVFSLP